MPENDIPTTEFDPLAVSVHSMDSGLDPETDPTDTPPVQSEVKTEVEEPEKETETEVETEPADGEEDDDLAALGFPALPDELKDNPDISKRYEETQYGIQKVVRQQQDVLAELRKYEKLATDLNDPATAQTAYDFLGKQLQEEGLLKLSAPAQIDTSENADQWKEWRDDWENRGLTKADFDDALTRNYLPDYPGEYKAYRDAKAENDLRFGPIDQERKQTQESRAHQDFVDKEHPRVAGFLAKTENGWSVTKEMVSQAVKEFPHLKDDLVTAVKRTFPNEYANHKVQAVLAAKGDEGPEMISNGSSASRGKVLHEIDPDASASADVHKIAENLAALSS